VRCAPFEARGPMDVLRGIPSKSIWNMETVSNDRNHSAEFFTESLILAQNERWRRV
jgi:hypothetical protein